MTSQTNSPPKRAIILFTFSPLREARVKPIAGASFGERVAMYRELVEHALQVTEATPYPVLIATDDVAQRFSAKASARMFPQRGANFNERLTAALLDAFGCGYDEVVIIGNDCAGLTASDLDEAFGLLQRHEVALGSAADGGVYLIAARRSALRNLTAAFARCRWQTAHVQEDLLAQAALLGIDTALMATHTDLDTAADVLREAASYRELRVLVALARRLYALIVLQNFPRFFPFLVSRRFMRLRYQRPPPALAI